MNRVTSAVELDRARDERVDRVLERWPAARPLVVPGAAGVVVGGLVAAVTGPTGFERGSWTAAYLVLVGGVAPIVLGALQAWLAAEPPPRRLVWAEVAVWNVSLVAVVAGTVAAGPVLTSLGGIALMAALVAFLVAVRGSDASPGWVRTLYVWTVVVVLAGAPVGLVLAWVRRG